MKTNFNLNKGHKYYTVHCYPETKEVYVIGWYTKYMYESALRDGFITAYGVLEEYELQES